MVHTTTMFYRSFVSLYLYCSFIVHVELILSPASSKGIVRSRSCLIRLFLRSFVFAQDNSKSCRLTLMNFQVPSILGTRRNG